MSTRIRVLTVAALLALCHAMSAGSAEYVLTFRKESARFEPDLADNRRSFTALVSLLQDFGSQPSLHIVLAGELRPACSAAPDCEALLLNRVEALATQIMDRSGGPAWIRALRWRGIPGTAAPVEGLRLRLLSDGTPLFSARCPYQVELADPRLPPLLGAVPARFEWVTVQGPAAVPITIDAQLRVRSAARVEITAWESYGDARLPLGSGLSQAQWTARQLKWHANLADVIVTGPPEDAGAHVPGADRRPPLERMDVGDELLDLPMGPLAPPPAAVSGCHLRLRWVSRL